MRKVWRLVRYSEGLDGDLDNVVIREFINMKMGEEKQLMKNTKT